MSAELQLLKSTIDLAAAQRQGESIEWLPLHAVLQAFKETCQMLHISPSMEQKCYQILLLMSADSEQHLTWWERVYKINHYTELLNSGKTIEAAKKTSFSPNQSSFSSPSPRKIGGYVMRVTDSGRQLEVPEGIVSHSTQSLLHEGAELSMLLNNQLAADRGQSRLIKPALSQSTSAPSSKRVAKSGLPLEQHLSRLATSVLDSEHSPIRAHTDVRNSNSQQPVLDQTDSFNEGKKEIHDLHEKIASIRKETDKTRSMIAALADASPTVDKAMPFEEEKGEIQKPPASDLMPLSPVGLADDHTLRPSALKYNTFMSPDLSVASGNCYPYDYMEVQDEDHSKLKELFPDSIALTAALPHRSRSSRSLQDLSTSLRSSAVMMKYLNNQDKLTLTEVGPTSMQYMENQLKQEHAHAHAHAHALKETQKNVVKLSRKSSYEFDEIDELSSPVSDWKQDLSPSSKLRYYILRIIVVSI